MKPTQLAAEEVWNGTRHWKTSTTRSLPAPMRLARCVPLWDDDSVSVRKQRTCLANPAWTAASALKIAPI